MKISLKTAPLLIAAVFVGHSLSAQKASDGDAAFQLGQIDKAVGIYEQVAKAAPTDINAALQLGNLYLAQGKQDQALATFQKAATINPEDKLAMVANARIALLSGKTDESVKQINSAVKAAKGKNTNLLRQAGESYFFGKTKNLKRAAELLDAANQSNTKDFATLMSLGWVNKELLEGGKAVTFYEFAADLDKSNPVPVFRIGQVYKQSRNWLKYEESLKKALTIDPNFMTAARDLGDHYYTFNKMSLAKQMYDQFITKNSPDITIEDRMQYANILFLVKDYKNLVPYVDEIVKMDGSRNYLRRLLGYAAYETGDYDKGMGIMNDYFAKVKPADIIADDYEFYGKLLEKKGQDSLAFENYVKAVKMEPEKQFALNKSAGKLALKLGRNEEAVRYFTINATASRGDEGDMPPVSSEDFYWLALATEKVKNFEQADSLWGTVVKMSPSAATGYRQRARLQKKAFEPDVIADATKAPEYGMKSQPYYDKWLEVVNAAIAKEPKDADKYKKDLIEIYNEKVFYFSVHEDIATATEWANKVLALDPNNANVKSFFEQINASGGTPATPVPPTPPVLPKGKQ